MTNHNQTPTFNGDDEQEVLNSWPRIFNERICQILESSESNARVMMHIRGGYADLQTALEQGLISDESQFRPERAFFEAEDIVATMGGKIYDNVHGIILLDPEGSGQMLSVYLYFGNHTAAMASSINGAMPTHVNRQCDDGRWVNNAPISDQEGWGIVTSLSSVANQLADRSGAGYQLAGGDRDNIYQLAEHRVRYQKDVSELGELAVQFAA